MSSNKKIAHTVFALLIGVLLYQYHSNGNLFISIILAVPIIIIGVTIIFWMNQDKKVTLKSVFQNLMQILISSGILLCTGFAYVSVRNSSPVILSAGFIDEFSVCIDFRQNGTYRVRYSDLFTDQTKYGRCEKIDNIIILKDKIHFGHYEILNDSIQIIDNEFRLNYQYKYSNNLKNEFVVYVTNYKEECIW